MSQRYVRALREQRKRTESHNDRIAGVLGMVVNGVQTVEVPNRPSYVYVKVRSSEAEIIQAFNSKVAPVYGLPVIIQWQGNRYIVVERDGMRYSNWIDSSAYLPRHASTHEWSGSAGDIVFSSQEQLLPLVPSPSGVAGCSAILIGDYKLMDTSGAFLYSPYKMTEDLTAYNPSSGAVMILVALDAQDGSLHYETGTVFDETLTGTSDVLSRIPNNPDISRYLPIAGVRLTNGLANITWDNIYDVRQMFGTTRVIGGGGGGGGAYLLLDASNGPLTGELDITPSAEAYPNYGLHVDATTYVGVAGILVEANNEAWGIEIDNDNAPADYAPSLAVYHYPDAEAVYVEHSLIGNNDYEYPTYYSFRYKTIGAGANFVGPVFLMEERSNAPGGVLTVLDSSYDDRLHLNPGVSVASPYNVNDTNYYFDTFEQIATGSLLMEVRNFGSQKFRIGAAGDVNIPAGQTYNINGAPHTHDGLGGLAGISAQDDGVPQGTGTVINLRGENTWASVSGTVIDILISGTPGPQGVPGAGNPGMMVLDEGVPLGTGTILNFRGDPIVATISGSMVDVYITGSSGGSSYPTVATIFYQPGGNIDTTSASYVAVSSCPTVNFTKVQDDTSILITLTSNLRFVGSYGSATYGVSCSSGTWDMSHVWLDGGHHLNASGIRKVALPAGSYTFTVVWKRVDYSDENPIRMDANDYLSCTIQEVMS